MFFKILVCYNYWKKPLIGCIFGACTYLASFTKLLNQWIWCTNL